MDRVILTKSNLIEINKIKPDILNIKNCDIINAIPRPTDNFKDFEFIDYHLDVLLSNEIIIANSNSNYKQFDIKELPTTSYILGRQAWENAGVGIRRLDRPQLSGGAAQQGRQSFAGPLTWRIWMNT